MMKISYAGCLGLSLAILAQFTFEMRVATQNREKFIKTTYFGGPRSFKVIDVNISKKLVASACYNKQHICVTLCDHFHVRRDNSGKITSFLEEVPLFRPLVRGDPFTQWHAILS